MKKEVLRMEHVDVRRHGRNVLSDFKLNIYEGEFVVLFGFSSSGIYEVGDILSGRQKLEHGRILLSEREVNLKKDFFWEKEGVFSVYNEQNLMPDLSVAENLFFGGSNKTYALVVSAKKQYALARQILSKFDVDIDVTKKARELLFDEEIMVRLIKAYTKGARLVVVNELAELSYIHGGPKIIEILKKLKDDGIAILWINHRLDSIKHLVDGITVLCNGENVWQFYHDDYTMEHLLKLAEDDGYYGALERPQGSGEGTALTFEGVTSRFLNNLSMEIKNNQITGIWANEPMSLDAIRSIACGELQGYAGSLYLRDKLYIPEDYEDAVRHGVQYIDIMWHERHAISDMDIVDNLMLQNYWLQKPMFAKVSTSWQKYVDAGYRQRHGNLNKEKWYELTADEKKVLLFERCLGQPGKVYFITEAFSAFNYKMTEQVSGIFQEFLDKGKTLILLSVDIKELTRVCSEIYLIQDRKLVRKVAADEFDSLDIWNYVS